MATQSSGNGAARSGDSPYPSSFAAWYSVAVLMLMYIFSFIDRQILNLLVAPVRRDLAISDTQNNTYIPLVPDATNEFAYRGGLVPAKSQLPLPESVASSGATQGALLLYKIQIVSLDNRPLELKIVDPTDAAQTASAELDV